MAAANKTRATKSSVAAYLAGIEDPTRRADCKALAALMRRLTGQAPRLWGSSIVGFGTYHYTYATGREGDMCRTGFSARKGNISIYLMGCSTSQNTLLKKLGRHKMGKACLYVRTLEDVDMKVLEALVVDSLAAVRKRYG